MFYFKPVTFQVPSSYIWQVAATLSAAMRALTSGKWRPEHLSSAGSEGTVSLPNFLLRLKGGWDSAPRDSLGCKLRVSTWRPRSPSCCLVPAWWSSQFSQAWALFPWPGRIRHTDTRESVKQSKIFWAEGNLSAARGDMKAGCQKWGWVLGLLC